MDLKEKSMRLRADLYSLQTEKQRVIDYIRQIDQEIALMEGELRFVEKVLAKESASGDSPSGQEAS